MTHLKEMEMFKFNGVRKELTSGIAKWMYLQWMEGTAESCSLHLLTPCQILTQVSLA